MSTPIFFIPGFHGSGSAHWQTWLQNRLPDCETLRDVGCLVAAVVAAEKPATVAGIIFVAPANPDRFAAEGGIRNTRFDGTPQAARSTADILPERLPPRLPSALLASENDPWLSFSDAFVIARRWNSHFVDLGEAGHVNIEAGYGPWPGLLRQLRLLRTQKTPDFTTLHRASLESGDLAFEHDVHAHPHLQGVEFAL